jgi:hypothetical protein
MNGVSELGLQMLIYRLVASFIILAFLTLPVYLVIKRKWEFIEKALAGVDGITDVHELRIGASLAILFGFMIIYFFMLITYGALGWEWPDILFTYTFLGTTGAEASLIISLIQLKKLKS